MAQKTDVFPIIVKKGSSLVKIYRDASSSGDYYRAVYLYGGEGHRLNSADSRQVLFPRERHVLQKHGAAFFLNFPDFYKN